MMLRKAFCVFVVIAMVFTVLPVAAFADDGEGGEGGGDGGIVDNTSDYEKAKDDFDEKKGEAERSNEDYEKSKEKYDETLGEYNQAVEDYKGKSDDIEEIEKHGKDVEDFNNRSNGYSSELNNYITDKGEYDKAIADYQAKYPSDKFGDEAEYNAAMAEFDRLRAWYDALETERERLNTEGEKLNDEANKLTERRNNLDGTLTSLTDDMTEIKALLDKLEGMLGDEENSGLADAYEQALEDYKAAKGAYDALEAEYLKLLGQYIEDKNDYEKWVNNGGSDDWEELKGELINNTDDYFYDLLRGELKDIENPTDQQIYDAALKALEKLNEMVAASDAAQKITDDLVGFMEGKSAQGVLDNKNELSDIYAKMLKALEDYDGLFGTDYLTEFKAKYAALLSAVESGDITTIGTALEGLREYLVGNGLRNIKADKAKLEVKKAVEVKIKGSDDKDKKVKYGYAYDTDSKTQFQQNIFLLDVISVQDESKLKGIKIPVYGTEKGANDEDAKDVLGYVEHTTEKATYIKKDGGTEEKDTDVLILYGADKTEVGKLVYYENKSIADEDGQKRAVLTLAPGTSITFLYCTEGSDFQLAVFTNNTGADYEWDFPFHFHNTGITFNEYTPAPNFDFDYSSTGMAGVPGYQAEPSIEELIQFGLPNPNKYTDPVEYLKWLEMTSPDFYAELIDSFDDWGLTRPELEEVIRQIINEPSRRRSTTTTTMVPLTTITDEDVPLGEVPEDLVTIVDEDVPLGALPTTGGSANTGGISIVKSCDMLDDGKKGLYVVEGDREDTEN